MPGMGLNLYEEPPVRTLQGSTWGGLGWRFDASDAAEIHELVAALSGQHDALKREALAITNKAVSGPYLTKLGAVQRQLSTIYRNASALAYKTKANFDSVMGVLTVAIPKTLSVMAPLIAADRRDPSGKTSTVMIKKSIEVTRAQQEERMRSFAMDPMAWLKRNAKDAGKGLSDLQWALFKEWLRVMWPWLLVGGGALGAFYFWPVIGKVLAHQRAQMARKPGDLLPGTTHQPGE